MSGSKSQPWSLPRLRPWITSSQKSTQQTSVTNPRKTIKKKSLNIANHNIDIGEEKNRWEAAKSGLSSTSDESLAKLLLDLYFFWLGPQVSLKATEEQKSLDVVLNSKKLESFAFDEVYDNELEQAELKEEIKVDLDDLIESPDLNIVSSSPSIDIISSSGNITEKSQSAAIKATPCSRTLSITADEHGSTYVETSALEEKEVDLVLTNASSSAHSQENCAVNLDHLPQKISETITISSQSNLSTSIHLPISESSPPPPNGTQVKRTRGRPKKKKRPLGRPRGRPKMILSNDSTASIQLPRTGSTTFLSEPGAIDPSHKNAVRIANSKSQGGPSTISETLGCSSSSPVKGPRARPRLLKSEDEEEEEEEDIERYSDESLNQDPDFSMGDSSFELEDESFEMLIDDWNDNPKELKANGLIGAAGDEEGEEEDDVCERRSRSRSVKIYCSVGDEEEGNSNVTDMGENDMGANGIEDADTTKDPNLPSHSSSASSNETETRKKERKNKCRSKANQQPKRSVKDTWKSKYLEHFELVEGESKVVCRTCSARVDPITLLLARHLMRSHGLARKDGAIQPLFCDRGNCNGSVVFVSYEEYVRHLKSAHSTKKAKPKSSKKEVSEGMETICFLCGTMVKNLPCHLKKAHEDQNTVPCPHPGCGKIFVERHLRNHMRCHESGVCPYPECKKQFKSKNFLSTHIRNVHKSHLIKPLPCPHCSYVAKKVVHFNRHIREVHTMDRVFSCPEYGCNLSFKRACTLETHSRIHLNIKPYQCKWCEFTGAQQNNIRSHASTAHREEYLMAKNLNEKYWRRTESTSIPDHSISTQQLPIMPSSTPQLSSNHSPLEANYSANEASPAFRPDSSHIPKDSGLPHDGFSYV